MSSAPLKDILPAPTACEGEIERLRQFATAMAQRDRSRHRSWLRDADIERAIRGYLYAAAIAEHRVRLLTPADIDAAITAYRRARRLPARREPTQRSLIAFTDGAVAANAE